VNGELYAQTTLHLLKEPLLAIEQVVRWVI